VELGAVRLDDPAECIFVALSSSLEQLLLVQRGAR
jgi:hypothetical protein